VLIGDENRMQYCNNKYPILLPNPITQVADMPYPLYLSLQGKYFVGYADEMEFGNGTIALAGLVNPSSSGVNLHVYVWTVTNIGQLPLQAEIWFNTDPPGNPVRSELVTPANTAICPSAPNQEPSPGQRPPEGYDLDDPDNYPSNIEYAAPGVATSCVLTRPSYQLDRHLSKLLI
jgi:hypothetical protein